MTRYYAQRQMLALVPRRSLRDYQRDLLVQRFAEVDALRADLRRLQRLTSEVARCHRCRQLRTIHLQASGDWLCAKCCVAPREETA